jgi:hypothetical protein
MRPPTFQPGRDFAFRWQHPLRQRLHSGKKNWLYLLAGLLQLRACEPFLSAHRSSLVLDPGDRHCAHGVLGPWMRQLVEVGFRVVRIESTHRFISVVKLFMLVAMVAVGAGKRRDRVKVWLGRGR